MDNDEVFCHQCNSRWPRADHGLTCPHCQSEFTEILDDSDPLRDQMDIDLVPSRSPSPGTAHALRDHDPWDAEHAPDPDDGDIEEHITRNFGPGGSVSVTRTTFRSGPTPFGNFSGHGHVATFGHPNAHPIFRDFGQFMENLSGQSQRASETRRISTRNRSEPATETPGRMGGRFSYTSTATLSPRDANQAQPHIEPVDNISSLLEQLFMGMPGHPTGHGQMGFASILAAALNPANAASGDAVYTQEALDRVISGLMEQNQGSNATAPATEAAIDSLPKRKLVPQDFADNGKAECNICMDDVTVGDEVTVLPCGHWYHEACVSAWLKESDTCPVCRKGIMSKDGESRARSSHQDPRNPEPWRGGSSNPWSSITGSSNQTESSGGPGNSSTDVPTNSSGNHRRRSRPHSGSSHTSSHGSRSGSYRAAGSSRTTEGGSRRSSRSHGSPNSSIGGGLSNRVRNMFNGGSNST